MLLICILLNQCYSWFQLFIERVNYDSESDGPSRSMNLNVPATQLLEDDEAFIEKANTFKVSYPRETKI